MKSTLLAGILLATTSTLALAASDLTSKAMKDHPGVSSASSANTPIVGPLTGGFGLAEKAMRDHPGVRTTGSTQNPTSKPDADSLSAKAMRDHPGVMN